MRTVALAPALLALLAGVLAAPPSARAGEPCARLEVAGSLPRDWADGVAALRARIAELSASDCLPLRLSLEGRPGAFRLRATAPDGRQAERAVETPSDLVPVALGLLAATPRPPPGEASAPPAPPSATLPAPPPAPSPPAPSAVAGKEAPAPGPPVPPTGTAAPPSSALWLGLAAGVRLTAPQGLTVLDVEARADLPRGPWVLFGTVRSAVLSCLGQQGVDCDVYNDLGAGVGVARRVQTGAASIDLGLSPSITWMHIELDGAGESESVAGGIVALRVDGSARLVVPVGERTALTVTMDLGLSPSLLIAPQRLGSPSGSSNAQPFPTYSGGVRLGFAAGVL